MEKSVHCKDDITQYEAMMRNCESSDYEIFGPLIKSKNYHNYHVLPPPKIVIVIVDCGIVAAVKHQIGR